MLSPTLSSHLIQVPCAAAPASKCYLTFESGFLSSCKSKLDHGPPCHALALQREDMHIYSRLYLVMYFTYKVFLPKRSQAGPGVGVKTMEEDLGADLIKIVSVHWMFLLYVQEVVTPFHIVA